MLNEYKVILIYIIYNVGIEAEMDTLFFFALFSSHFYTKFVRLLRVQKSEGKLNMLGWLEYGLTVSLTSTAD